jgi:hypothetical protein
VGVDFALFCTEQGRFFVWRIICSSDAGRTQRRMHVHHLRDRTPIIIELVGYHPPRPSSTLCSAIVIRQTCACSSSYITHAST